jgi:hypothetical protein
LRCRAYDRKKKPQSPLRRGFLNPSAWLVENCPLSVSII